MKKIIRFGVLSLLFLTSLSYMFAVESPAGTVDFNIRFFDRRIYFTETDPIFIQITITNNSPSPYRFKLADDRVFSVDFEIRTMTNRALQQTDSLIRKRTVNSQVFFREITIESGESFSFVENLCDYIRFGQSGSFRVQAKIYPELFRSSVAAAIESNYLSLTLRPAVIPGPDGIPLEMDIATGAALVKQKLPPDEVVAYMINARQQSQWEKFFLYLDLEAMLKKDAFQSRRYNAENEEGRRSMVAAYKRNLQNAVVDGDIVVIPTSFEILKTQYNNDEGTVIVLQKYRNPNHTELREYTYRLEKKDNFWIIVNYSVQGMGTIAND
jgi:hypothetical protein